MSFLIRPFRVADEDSIVALLRRNGQYDYPDVEGPEAMDRVAECDAAVFLVAESSSAVVGCIRTAFDGSRAVIHLLSVLPEYQGRGMGTALVKSVMGTLSDRGAATISVTATDSSQGFWSKLGFDKLPVFLMLRDMK